MNKNPFQFSVNDLFSKAVIVFSDGEGSEVARISFWVVILMGFFSGFILLGLLFVAVKQWKVSLVNKEEVLE